MTNDHLNSLTHINGIPIMVSDVTFSIFYQVEFEPLNLEPFTQLSLLKKNYFRKLN